jgi:hypothetical protein
VPLPRGPLLAEQLQHVGQRLHQAAEADPVGAVAGLEAPQQLALEQQDERHDLEDDQEDDDRLDDEDPGRLGEPDLGDQVHWTASRLVAP